MEQLTQTHCYICCRALDSDDDHEQRIAVPTITGYGRDGSGRITTLVWAEKLAYAHSRCCSI